VDGGAYSNVANSWEADMSDGIFKNGYALFIGVGGKDISVTIDDATALHNFFTDQNKASYPKNQVRLLTEKNATRQGILENLDWLIQQTKANSKSTAIVYYSGHGGRFEHLLKPNEYYLIPTVTIQLNVQKPQFRDWSLPRRLKISKPKN